MTRAADRRSTTNRNVRGSSYDRARRRAWLVDHFGDGLFVACWHCWATLAAEQVSPDRIIPGCDGGTYRRSNLRPSCLKCQMSTGGALGAARAAANRLQV